MHSIYMFKVFSEDLNSFLLESYLGFFYNTTWAEERGKCLPDPEFFA